MYVCTYAGKHVRCNVIFRSCSLARCTTKTSNQFHRFCVIAFTPRTSKSTATSTHDVLYFTALRVFSTH